MNRKKAKEGKKNIKAQISRLVPTIWPDWTVEFVGQQGHAAKVSRTFGFRLKDERGRYRSNIIWVDPEYLGKISIGGVAEGRSEMRICVGCNTPLSHKDKDGKLCWECFSQAAIYFLEEEVAEKRAIRERYGGFD